MQWDVQFPEQATMLQRAVALSVMKGVGHFIPHHLTLLFVVLSLLTWRLGGREEP